MMLPLLTKYIRYTSVQRVLNFRVESTHIQGYVGALYQESSMLFCVDTTYLSTGTP